MDNKKSINTRLHTSFEADEKFLESIVDTVRESLLVLSSDLTVTSANRTFYTKFNVDPKGTIGKKIYDLGNGQWNIPLLKKLLEEILPLHNPFNNFRVEHEFPDIGKKVMLLNARQIKQKGKWEDRILLAIEDISESDRDRQEKRELLEREKKAMIEIETREEKFRTLIEQSADAIELIDRDGRIIYASESVERVIGYSPKEILGDTVFPYIHPDDVDYFSRKMADLFKKEGNQVTAEYRVRHKSGQWVWIEATGVNHLHNPSVGAIVGNFRNITDRKEAEMKLQEQAALIQVSNDAFIVLDEKNRILSWNNGAEVVYGFSEKEAVGKIARDLLKTCYPIPKEQIYKKILKEKSWRGEIEHTTKDGSLIIVDSNWVLLTQKPSIKILEVNRDITDRKILERQKDDFISIATHELKTPVTSIKAYAQVLHQLFLKKEDKRSADYLAKMDGQLNKLTSLIADLLDVTKIQSGRLQFHQEYFDFNELIEETVEQLQLTTEKHKLIQKLDKTKVMYGDRDRIGQVLTNLISNAIKYSPYSDRIIISTHLNGSSITLSVQDFGVGIPKDKQDQVFEKFFRVSGPKEQTFPGMGLGLYISSEIIKRQGGQIWVESIEDKGSTFYFTLPINTKGKTVQERNTLVRQEMQHE